MCIWLAVGTNARVHVLCEFESSVDESELLLSGSCYCFGAGSFTSLQFFILLLIFTYFFSSFLLTFFLLLLTFLSFFYTCLLFTFYKLFSSFISRFWDFPPSHSFCNSSVSGLQVIADSGLGLEFTFLQSSLSRVHKIVGEYRSSSYSYDTL